MAKRKPNGSDGPNGNGKKLPTQQSVNSAVKGICDIMRRSNCAGALQYVPELTWILFLRILDEREAREAGPRPSATSSRRRWSRPTAGRTGPPITAKTGRRHPTGTISKAGNARSSTMARWATSSASSTPSCSRI